MSTLLINYADRHFYQAQKLNIQTAITVAGFDRALPLGRNHLDAEFYHRNRQILDQPRGAGYWLWKPHLILKVMRQVMALEDVVFYCDSGCHFISSVAPIIELCRRQPEDKPIVLFTLPAEYKNRIYTKRDCFYYMGLDRVPYLDSTQILGTFLVCRKTPSAIAFLEEWLHYAQDPRILTEAPNECGLQNYPEFQSHRHDQSILSLLGRKHEILAVPDISQWGNDYRPRDIPQIIQHTRWSA
jgi:hypothetical protein